MTLQEIKSVFSEVLDLGDSVDWASARYQQTDNWDSMHHMAIVGELEDRFAIMLDTDDVLELSSFEEALRILKKYGVETT
jgi:acyl carrier protein